MKKIFFTQLKSIMKDFLEIAFTSLSAFILDSCIKTLTSELETEDLSICFNFHLPLFHYLKVMVIMDYHSIPIVFILTAI